jgi:hypothetical protein
VCCNVNVCRRYVANLAPGSVWFEVGFQMGVKVTTGGQFDRFDYYGPDETARVPFEATADEMRAALEALGGIGVLTVSKSEEEGDFAADGGTEDYYALADWEITFVSDKGNVPMLRAGCPSVSSSSSSSSSSCAEYYADSSALLNASLPPVMAVEVEEVVHGCLSPELCLDPDDFYVDGLAATAESGVVTFRALSVDVAGAGYRLRFELEGSDGNVTVDGEALEIALGEPAFLAAEDLVLGGAGAGGGASAAANNGRVWADGDALAEPPVVVLWDAGFNRLARLTTDDGMVVAAVVDGGGDDDGDDSLWEAPDPMPVVPAFTEQGMGSQCTDASLSFVPSHYRAAGVSAGVCREICAAHEGCSGYMANSSAQRMGASHKADTSDLAALVCWLFVNASYAAAGNDTAVTTTATLSGASYSSGYSSTTSSSSTSGTSSSSTTTTTDVCPSVTFTVTTDWNRTAFAVNGQDLAALTDNVVADRPSQLYVCLVVAW